MKTFITDEYMLHSELAVTLYKKVKELPIIDYHSHLSAQDIFENKRFESITEAWLKHDHYKWRQMRSLGIDEDFITGNKNDFEKFYAYIRTLDYAIGNPLVAWSHLEIKEFFDIELALTQANATEIFRLANSKIDSGEVDVRNIIKKSNVKMIGTTDDILDNLKWHELIANDDAINVIVLPTFRPDRFLNIDDTSYKAYLNEFEEVIHPINTFEDFIDGFLSRIEYFAKRGCKIADHGISYFHYLDTDVFEAESIFNKFMNGSVLTSSEEIKFKSYMYIFLAKEYKKRNWTLQLHIGATRNNNAMLFEKVGTDAGSDAISDISYITPLSEYFKTLSQSNDIGKTIVYNLDPTKNYPIAALIGSFQNGPEKGLIQFGSGWWFNDQYDGIVTHLQAHSQLGLLRVFIGMLTDSRSFLSFTRHDYFRRILCNFVANLVNEGQYHNDIDLLTDIVSEICCENAIEYFELGEK